MTTEIEKQFFDTFGIEPKEKVNQTFNGAEFKVETIKVYPQISDRMFLELYCILCDAFNLLNINRHPAFVFNIKDFKKFVLKDLIDVENFYKNEYIKQQVQTLFKGCE